MNLTSERIMVVSLILLGIIELSGCSSLSFLLSEETIEYVEPMNTNRGYLSSGQYSLISLEAYVVSLPKYRNIRKIIIRPHGRVRNLEVFVRTGENEWKRIKQIKQSSDSAIIVRTFIRGNAVRVIRKTVSSNTDGYIDGVDVWAVKE